MAETYKRDCRDRALAVLLAVLALLSVLAVLALANRIYIGWVCAEKAKEFQEMNVTLVKISSPQECIVLPACPSSPGTVDCHIHHVGRLAASSSNPAVTSALIGHEGMTFCGDASVSSVDFENSTAPGVRLMLCSVMKVVSSLSTPLLESACGAVVA